jgi:hypothetical protein
MFAEPGKARKVARAIRSCLPPDVRRAVAGTDARDGVQ